MFLRRRILQIVVTGFAASALMLGAATASYAHGGAMDSHSSTATSDATESHTGSDGAHTEANTSGSHTAEEMEMSTSEHQSHGDVPAAADPDDGSRDWIARANVVSLLAMLGFLALRGRADNKKRMAKNHNSSPEA